MEVFIKYKAISYEGERTSFVEQHTCPDFKSQPERDFDGHRLPGISIESQVLDWLDDQDKHYLISKHDLMCILDYEVYTGLSVSLPEIFESRYESFGISEEVKNNIIATYAVMKGSIENLPIEKQIEIVLSAMDVGFKSSGEAYRRISAILDGKNPDEVENEPQLIES